MSCAEERLIASRACVAVGEDGLDFTERPSTLQNQRVIFWQQLEMAKTHNKPTTTGLPVSLEKCPSGGIGNHGIIANGIDAELKTISN